MTGLGEWDTHHTAVDAPAAPQPPRLYYPTVEAFVTEHLSPLYRRDIDERHRVWCPQWWLHAEAVTRLEALWRAWEHLRLDPATGMSVWLRDHADHHMPVLLSPDGPFKGCTSTKGHSDRLDRLPVQPPPEGLFQATEPSQDRQIAPDIEASLRGED